MPADSITALASTRWRLWPRPAAVADCPDPTAPRPVNSRPPRIDRRSVRLHRGVRRSLLLVVFAALPAVLAPSASASDDRCASGAGPASCVRVVGGGQYVEYVQPGVSVWPFWPVEGRHHVFGRNGAVFDRLTEFRSYEPTSRYYPSTQWGSPLRINGFLPDGSQLCAEFLEGLGVVKSRGVACVHITRSS